MFGVQFWGVIYESDQLLGSLQALQDGPEVCGIDGWAKESLSDFDPHGEGIAIGYIDRPHIGLADS